MSFLLNKRKRDDSSNDFNSLPNVDTSKNYQENNNINIPEELLIEENNNNNIDNIQKNENKLDPFQVMFQSINSRKDEQNNNNMILSPLCSNLFFGSIQKLKNFDKILGSNVKSGILLSKSNSSFLRNKKSKIFFTPSSLEMENNFNFETCFNNNNNNINEKMKINLDFDFFNISEKKNIFDLNLDNKLNNDDINNDNDNENNNIKLNDIFPMKQTNLFENTKNNDNNNFTFNSCEENSPKNKNKEDNIEVQINSSLFSSSDKNNKNINKKNNKNIPQKILNPKNSDTFSFKRPFCTFRTKFVTKSSHAQVKKKVSNKPKIFHIEKIYNKKEYKEVNAKEEIFTNKKNILIDKYKISLKKIKQIYFNSCLKIYTYLNSQNTFNEKNLSNEAYISEIIHQVNDIVHNRRISSSKMNEILQVSDDDKYRKHYFMFSSEAKQFCLDLINKKKYPLDITMKMCKVPRKSLRRWCHVGCLRKKGCGRKTKNPKMEAELVMWYNNIKKNINVTAKMIRDKAVEISKDKDFLASKGWLEKFKKKNGIQIINNKRIRKTYSIDMDNNTINYTSNNSINNTEYNCWKEKENEKEKDTDKMEYEINIINDSYKGKINKDEKKDKKEKLVISLNEEDGKENTNSNI